VSAGALAVLVGCDLGAPPTTHPAPGAVVGAGDVNGDGLPDLVTSGNGTEFGVLLGDGSGGFAPVSLIPHLTTCDTGDPTWTCSRIVASGTVDLNRDGLLDVVVSYDFANNYPPPDDDAGRLVDVRLADGTGGFTAAPRGTPGSGVFADMTNDGALDVVSTTDRFNPPRLLRVHPGTAAGFGAPVTTDLSGLGSRSGGLVVHDMNGDGNLDVVLGGMCVGGLGSDEQSFRGCIDVMLGDGTGQFTASTRAVAADPEVDSLNVMVADVTEDGRPDVVGAAQGVDYDSGGPVGAISVFPGDGAGGLAAEIVGPAFVETTSLEPGDFDGDGHLDVLTDTDNGNTDWTDDYRRVMFGDGAGGFGDSHVVGIDGGVVADLDLDGRPDLASTTDGVHVTVYMNRWEGRPG
jgi:hypothetical protein